MSLQLWLPMTKDFSNQGLQNSTITNNSATLDNNGKLGKCGYFNGSTYLKGTIDCTDWVDYTLACWIKPPAASAGNKQVIAIGKSSGWTNCRATIVYVQNSTDVIAGFSDGTNSIQYGMRITLTANAWNHVAVTYSNKTLKFYLNGVYQKSYTTTFDPKFSDITNFGVAGASDGAEKFTGYINDVRIYNHCLSDREVEILSRGLVCHFPLTGGGRGGDNLLKTSPKSHSAGSYNAYELNLSENLVAGQTYTIQLWDATVTNASKTADQLGIWVYWGGGSVALTSWSGSDFDTNGHANHLQKTITITSSQASGSGATNAWLVLYNSVPMGSGTRSMEVGRWKVEKGSVATPWIPNSADAEYTTMGYSDTTEYDVSGYEYNMTAVGSRIYSSDTPRYSVSTVNATGKGFYLTPNPVKKAVGDPLTVSCWFKQSNRSGYQDLVVSRDGSAYNWMLYFHQTDGSLQLHGASQYKSTIIPSLNIWHHVVAVVYSNNTYSMWLDGNKVIDATSYQYNTGSPTYFCIGKYGTSTTINEPFQGQISDVRIYSTSFSDSQVIELYNTAVSVANNGTLLGYELVEV